VVEATGPGGESGAICYDAALIGDPAIVRRGMGSRADTGPGTAGRRPRASREQLWASRARIVEAADAERQRIVGDLHDGL
jgi:signal transduction histidine kinase